MPFDWLRPHSGLPASIRSARARAMYRAELAERAALLCRLGYSRDSALSRLRANVAWDFESTADRAAPSAKDIAAVIAAAYGK